MAYWLFKSEPDTWSWDDQVAKGDMGEEWNGVRNYQARNNMRAMKIGDRGFFYHSNTERAIVGVVEVIAPSHPDSKTDDPRWDCVDIKALYPVTVPVSLDHVKAHPGLCDMALVKSPRLSVQPVSDTEWTILCTMAKIDPETGKSQG